LLTRFKQTAETQGFQLPDARIVERADAPLFPASPKRKQLVAAAVAGGAVLAIALALLLDLIAPGINRSEDVERVLEVAHLSSVPAVTGAGQPSLDPAKAVRLIVAEPASPYADAIRNARRALDVKRLGPQPRVILVTSSMPGEGAETIASNLAHHYAMTGTRVLLADGDLRRYPLTRQLAAGRQTGLLDQIIAGRPAEAAILRDGLTGLNFLPATGPQQIVTSVPELLSSPQFGAALHALRQRFDTIVLSAPPLLPVIDGRILADYCDQIVFVMTWQKTPKQLARKAMKTLGYNERKIAGAILNDVADDEMERDLPLILRKDHQAGSGSAPKRAA
jgi:succinoglycan biosynthesis transport protein ExoP